MIPDTLWTVEDQGFEKPEVDLERCGMIIECSMDMFSSSTIFYVKQVEVTQLGMEVMKP